MALRQLISLFPVSGFLKFEENNLIAVELPIKVGNKIKAPLNGTH